MDRRSSLPWRAWLALYLGAGLVGQAAGYVWDPTGAGSSVAMFGLFAGMWLAPTTHARAIPGAVERLTSIVGLAILASVLGAALVPNSALVPGVLAAVVGGISANISARVSWRTAQRGMAATATVGGVLLTALHDNHGPAVVAGVLIAWLLTTTLRSWSTDGLEVLG